MQAVGPSRAVMYVVPTDLLRPRRASPGDKVAVPSPSAAAPAVGTAVHEQAMRRLREVTGLLPVEYPTTRRLGASAAERAADLNAAFADPQIRAVLATIGGQDQITVIPHLDADAVRADPKSFVGYSDNTNVLSWLRTKERLQPADGVEAGLVLLTRRRPVAAEQLAHGILEIGRRRAPQQAGRGVQNLRVTGGPPRPDPGHQQVASRQAPGQHRDQLR